MNTFYIILLLFGFSAIGRDELPDLNKKEDLKALGTGKIIESDNSVISKIMLYEVHEYWIIYVKDESLHEMNMDAIKRMEFKETKWGIIKITFSKNKPVITRQDF